MTAIIIPDTELAIIQEMPVISGQPRGETELYGTPYTPQFIATVK